jgi:hypothetical protein
MLQYQALRRGILFLVHKLVSIYKGDDGQIEELSEN